MKTRVLVLDEVQQPIDQHSKLCLQKVIYQYGEEGGQDEGYRFMYRDIKTNCLRSLRGGANCISLKNIEHMLTIAKSHGMT